MEFVKKFQYSLILFVITGMIVAFGLLPYGGKIAHRYGIGAEDYVAVVAEVVEVTENHSSLYQVSYDMRVVYDFQGEEWESSFNSPSKRAVGTEISLICYGKDPSYVLESWYEWRQFYLYLGLSMMGVMTGLMMMNPQTVVSRARKRPTLRQRLDRR